MKLANSKYISESDTKHSDHEADVEMILNRTTFHQVKNLKSTVLSKSFVSETNMILKWKSKITLKTAPKYIWTENG